MRVGWLALGLVLLSACGADEARPPSPSFESGSRLRARVDESEGGLRIFEGWFDSSLEADCSFQTADDGALRCVPITVSVAYLDAGCTEPVVLGNAGCPLPGAVGVQLPPVEGDACSDDSYPVRAHRLGEPLRPAEVHYDDGDGNCSAGQPLPPGTPVRALGAAIPAAELVEGRFEDEPRGDRLAVRFLVGDDGSREISSIQDTEVGATCYPMEVGDERRCMPYTDQAYAAQTRFADGECTDEVAIAPSLERECPAPQWILRFDRSSCGDRTRSLHELGDPVEPGYHLVEDACVAIEHDADGSPFLFHIGQPADGSGYVPVVRQEIGTGDLRSDVDATETGEPLSSPSSLRDSSGAPCSPIDFAGGPRRCLPGAIPRLWTDGSYYADAACTLEVLSVPDDPECAAPAPTLAARIGPGPCTEEVTEVLSVGELLAEDAELYFDGPDLSCTPQLGPHPGEAFRMVGEPVSPDAFPILTQLIE